MSEGTSRPWPEVRLGELGNLRTSRVDKLTSPNETIVRLVNYMDVYRNRFIDSSLNLQKVTASSAERLAFQVKKGDVLFTPSSETPDDICHAAAVVEYLPETLHSYHTVRLRLTEPAASDVRFLAQLLNADRANTHLTKRATGSTRYTLKLDDFRSVPVALPPLSEQRRIAEVLDTIDETIQATGRVITKQSAVLVGLSEALFVKAARRRRLSELSRRITYGFTNPMPTVTTGPWMLTAADVGHRELLLHQARRTSDDAFQGLSNKSRPSAGDILVTKDGTLGRVAVLGTERTCVNQSVAVISPLDRSESEFIAEYLLSPAGQQALLAGAGGSTIKHLYISAMGDVEVPWPDPDVRSRTVATIRSAVERIAVLRHEAEKLQRLRIGLAADLLSGRVRTVAA